MSVKLVWLVDSSPGSDVPSRDDIGGRSEPARCTAEKVSGWTIGLSNTTAGATGAAGVSRINQKHRNTGQFRLVVDKATELEERPVVQSSSLPARGRYPVTDALKIFKSDSAPGALRRVDGCFADDVVDVALKAPLLAGEFSQLALGRARSLVLQVPSAVLVSAPVLLDSVSAVSCSVRVGGNVNDTEINAKDVLGLVGQQFLYFTDHVQVKRVPAEDEVNFAIAERQIPALVVATNEWYHLAPVECPDAHLVAGLEVENPVVVGDAPMLPESVLCLPPCPVGAGHFRNTADDNLSSQVELLPQTRIDQPLQRKPVECSFRPSNSACYIAGSIDALKSRQQCGVLFSCRLQFQANHELHGRTIPEGNKNIQHSQHRKDGAALPPHA